MTVDGEVVFNLWKSAPVASLLDWSQWKHLMQWSQTQWALSQTQTSRISLTEQNNLKAKGSHCS